MGIFYNAVASTRVFAEYLQEFGYLGGNNNFLDGNDNFSEHLQELGYLGGTSFGLMYLTFVQDTQVLQFQQSRNVIGREVRGGSVQATVYKIRKHVSIHLRCGDMGCGN